MTLTSPRAPSPLRDPFVTSYHSSHPSVCPPDSQVSLSRPLTSVPLDLPLSTISVRINSNEILDFLWTPPEITDNIVAAAGSAIQAYREPYVSTLTSHP